MSNSTTNFPPQTYSSSFYINALAEDDESLVSTISAPSGDEAKNTPVLDCFISTMEYLLFLPVLFHIGSAETPTNVTECYFDSNSPTRTFHSLVDYQASKNSFNARHPAYQGNVVDFDFKTIDRLPKNSFISFDSDYIIKLSLDHKEIQSVDAGAFMGLFCLHDLNLSFNNISHLVEGSFEALQNLLKLDLSHNLLGDIPDSGMIFFTLNGLRDLDLSYNKISTLEKYSFMTLRMLERLDLGHNKIRHVRDGLFDYLSSLKVLKLDHNYFAEISPENWKDLSSLRVLDLAGNYLTSFDSNYNFRFVYLKTLNLSDNSLRQFNVYSARKRLPKLELLDLSGNSWFCEDLEIIEHQLKDSRITLPRPVNCSVVRTSSVKYSTTETTPTTPTTLASVTTTQRDYSKEVFLQNGEILVSNKKLEDRVNELENTMMWMGLLILSAVLVEMAINMGVVRYFFLRCGRRNSRKHLMDSDDTDTVVLIRR